MKTSAGVETRTSCQRALLSEPLRARRHSETNRHFVEKAWVELFLTLWTLHLSRGVREFDFKCSNSVGETLIFRLDSMSKKSRQLKQKIEIRFEKCLEQVFEKCSRTFPSHLPANWQEPLRIHNGLSARNKTFWFQFFFASLRAPRNVFFVWITS